jgi:hypothetical protein
VSSRALFTTHSLRVALAVVLFNNSEEVKVSVRGEPRAHHVRAILGSGTGFDCIAHSTHKRVECGRHEFSCNQALPAQAGGLRVIGSSEQVHVVDALAITGEEGRGSLR